MRLPRTPRSIFCRPSHHFSELLGFAGRCSPPAPTDARADGAVKSLKGELSCHEFNQRPTAAAVMKSFGILQGLSTSSCQPRAGKEMKQLRERQHTFPALLMVKDGPGQPTPERVVI